MSFKTWMRGLAIAVVAFASCASARAAVITLQNQNSSATFFTTDADIVANPGRSLGLDEWRVDGVDHMSQQWFWYRTGSQTKENPVDGTGGLAHIASTPLDLDGDSLNEFLISDYSDNEIAITPEQFSLQFRYLLTGGAAGSNNSDLVEVVRVKNLGATPMTFNLFQYVDFDLNDDAGNDRLVITGSPVNTATQSDPINVIGETVVTPPPQHFEAALYPSIYNRLNDNVTDVLADVAGPIAGDATWSFQWDFSGVLQLPPGGVAIISKDKNLRPGDGGVLPEPSTFALGGIGLVALAAMRRRRAA
jgi:hypothetical protein